MSEERVPAQRAPARRGRKRDDSRDAVILDAALDVLAESGFAGMTVDEVAARAKAGKATVYRRWPTKGALVLDAVSRLNSGVDLAGLPDTGSLAGDLHALVGSETGDDDERRLRVMVGLLPMLADEHLAAAATDAIVGPWARANRVLLQRAVDRHEISAAADIETLAGVIPSLATYRVCIERQPIPPAYIRMLIDTVLLPALGIGNRQQRGARGQAAG